MMSSGETQYEGDSEFDLAADEGLPWLDSDEDDAGVGGFDTARIVAFVVILLLLLGAVIGALWYFTNQNQDPRIVADGSTIEAPEGPIKERPEDAGGKEFAGSGDVAPAVGEGKAESSVVAESTPASSPTSAATSTAQSPGSTQTAAAPSIDTLTTADTPASASAPVPVAQIGAYGSRSRAQTGWTTLSRQTSLLSGVKYRIERGQADIGIVYRLQVVRSSLDDARSFCRQLRAEGVACAAKRD